MSEALFSELEITGDVLLVWSGHRELGAHFAHCWYKLARDVSVGDESLSWLTAISESWSIALFILNKNP